MADTWETPSEEIARLREEIREREYRLEELLEAQLKAYLSHETRHSEEGEICFVCGAGGDLGDESLTYPCRGKR